MSDPFLTDILPQLATGASHTHALGFAYAGVDGDRQGSRAVLLPGLDQRPQQGRRQVVDAKKTGVLKRCQSYGFAGAGDAGNEKNAHRRIIPQTHKFKAIRCRPSPSAGAP